MEEFCHCVSERHWSGIFLECPWFWCQDNAGLVEWIRKQPSTLSAGRDLEWVLLPSSQQSSQGARQGSVCFLHNPELQRSRIWSWGPGNSSQALPQGETPFKAKCGGFLTIAQFIVIMVFVFRSLGDPTEIYRKGLVTIYKPKHLKILLSKCLNYRREHHEK